MYSQTLTKSMSLQDQLKENSTTEPLITLNLDQHTPFDSRILEKDSSTPIISTSPVITETIYQLPESDTLGTPLIIQTFTECLVNHQFKLQQIKEFIMKYDNTTPFPLQQKLVQSFIELMVSETTMVPLYIQKLV